MKNLPLVDLKEKHEFIEEVTLESGKTSIMGFTYERKQSEADCPK